MVRSAVVWLPFLSHSVVPSCSSASCVSVSHSRISWSSFCRPHLATSTASIPSEGTNFFFVTCTQDPKVGTKETLREVRQHVMYEYFRKRKQSGNSITDLGPRQRRLSGGPDPPSQHVFEETETVERPPQQHVNNSQSYNPSSENAGCQYSDEQVSLICSRVQSITNLNPPSLQSHRFDPFGVLPVNDAYIDAVAGWHFSNIVRDIGLPKISSIELMARERTMAYWRKAQTDKCYFYSLICLIEAKKARLTGQRNDVHYLEHKGEAIKMLHAELNNSRDVPSDQLIVLMYCLSGITLLDEGMKAARLHMNALIDIAAKLPNLSRFDDIAFLFIVRNDLRLAAAAFCKPVLPFSYRYAHLQPSVSLLAMASQFTLRSLRVLGSAYDDQAIIYGTFCKLHQMALLCDLEEPSVNNVRCLEGVVYWVDYHLCTLTSDEGLSCPEKASFPLTLVSMAAQLFAWSCLKFANHTWQTSSMKKVFGRFCRALLQTTTLLEDWQGQGQLESLLWALFIAHGISHTISPSHEPVVSRCRELGGEKKHVTRNLLTLGATVGLHELARDSPLSVEMLLVERLREVVARLGIHDEAGFEEALRLFPWTKHFSIERCKRAWEEIDQIRGC